MSVPVQDNGPATPDPSPATGPQPGGTPLQPREQAGRIGTCGLLCGGAGRHRPGHVPGRHGCVLHSGARESDELPRDLELPVLAAQPLQLQAEERPGGRAETRSRFSAPPGVNPLPDRPADHGKRLPRDVLQGALEQAAQRPAGVRPNGTPDGPSHGAEHVTEELLQFLLAGDLKELGGKLHLPRLAQRRFVPRARAGVATELAGLAELTDLAGLAELADLAAATGPALAGSR